MEQYLNTGIKEVIQRFPRVGEILGEYGIGCVTCGAGTCLLKDVVQIHGLPKDREAILMAQIKKTIYPESQLDLPGISLPSKPDEAAKPKYSPPIRELMEEHRRIKQLLACIPAIRDSIKIQTDRQLVNECVYFIRNYADKFHHAKEEDFLFKFVDESRDIIQVMLQEHQTGRNFVKSIITGLEADDKQQIIEGFTGYGDLLQQHIEKEDQILYPWIDKNLSTRQVGELVSRFNEVNRNFGRVFTERITGFLKRLIEL